jgi:hypothetical protein
VVALVEFPKGQFDLVMQVATKVEVKLLAVKAD